MVMVRAAEQRITVTNPNQLGREVRHNAAAKNQVRVQYTDPNAAQAPTRRMVKASSLPAPWIGVDFDGTLSHYDGWKGHSHFGKPIKRMVNRVKRWLAEGKAVKIFTARVAEGGEDAEKARRAIKTFCKIHFGRELDVTAVKDAGCTEIWDDRAHGVHENKGVQKHAGARSDFVTYHMARGHGASKEEAHRIVDDFHKDLKAELKQADAVSDQLQASILSNPATVQSLGGKPHVIAYTEPHPTAGHAVRSHALVPGPDGYVVHPMGSWEKAQPHMVPEPETYAGRGAGIGAALGGLMIAAGAGLANPGDFDIGNAAVGAGMGGVAGALTGSRVGNLFQKHPKIPADRLEYWDQPENKIAVIEIPWDKVRNHGGLAGKKYAYGCLRNWWRRDPDAFFAAVRMGMKVEEEHTDDRGLQICIALDHLSEDEKYYEKLKKMEKSAAINPALAGAGLGAVLNAGRAIYHGKDLRDVAVDAGSGALVGGGLGYVAGRAYAPAQPGMVSRGWNALTNGMASADGALGRGVYQAGQAAQSMAGGLKNKMVAAGRYGRDAAGGLVDAAGNLVGRFDPTNAIMGDNKTGAVDPNTQVTQEQGEPRGDEVHIPLLNNPYQDPTADPQQAVDYENGYQYAQTLGHLQLSQVPPEQIQTWQRAALPWRQGFADAATRLGKEDLANMLVGEQPDEGKTAMTHAKVAAGVLPRDAQHSLARGIGGSTIGGGIGGGVAGLGGQYLAQQGIQADPEMTPEQKQLLAQTPPRSGFGRPFLMSTGGALIGGLGGALIGDAVGGSDGMELGQFAGGVAGGAGGAFIGANQSTQNNAKDILAAGGLAPKVAMVKAARLGTQDYRPTPLPGNLQAAGHAAAPVPNTSQALYRKRRSDTAIGRETGTNQALATPATKIDAVPNRPGMFVVAEKYAGFAGRAGLGSMIGGLAPIAAGAGLGYGVGEGFEGLGEAAGLSDNFAGAAPEAIGAGLGGVAGAGFAPAGAAIGSGLGAATTPSRPKPGMTRAASFGRALGGTAIGALAPIALGAGAGALVGSMGDGGGLVQTQGDLNNLLDSQGITIPPDMMPSLPETAPDSMNPALAGAVLGGGAGALAAPVGAAIGGTAGAMSSPKPKMAGVIRTVLPAAAGVGAGLIGADMLGADLSMVPGHEYIGQASDTLQDLGSQVQTGVSQAGEAFNRAMAPKPMIPAASM